MRTLEIEVTAENSFVELDGVIIENINIDRKGPSVALPELLSVLGGLLDLLKVKETHSYTGNFISVLEALQTFRDRWNVELTFRIEISGNKIINESWIVEPEKEIGKAKGLNIGKILLKSKEPLMQKGFELLCMASGKKEKSRRVLMNRLILRTWNGKLKRRPGR